MHTQKVSGAFCLLVFRLSMTTAKECQKTSKDFVRQPSSTPPPTLHQPPSFLLKYQNGSETGKLCEKFKSLWRWQLFGTFACRLCQT